MGQRVSNEDYQWKYTDQPHLNRRKKIIKKYPCIKKLFGIDESFKYVVTANVFVQIVASYLLKDSSWSLVILQSYFFGGIINHGLTLAIHDISHNVAYGNSRPLANRLFGIFANLPIGIPMSISFKKYHVEHHRYLGEDKLDTDLPTELEVHLFATTFRKLVWLLLQPIFYAFRPLIIYKKAPTDLEIINAIVQISFDLLILWLFGLKSLFYLIFGTIIAMGIHPSAGHFISEHYIFFKDQETYSYYGCWNLVTYNVGYHVEHHDFPYVPGRNLPKIRAIASEFYEGLYEHKSWIWVLYQFIANPSIRLSSRIKRKPTTNQQFYDTNMTSNYFTEFLYYIGFYSTLRKEIQDEISGRSYQWSKRNQQ